MNLRHCHGALSLETIEPKVVFSGDAISDLDLDPKNRATQLIEEFMIATNGVTAAYLAAREFPSLRVGAASRSSRPVSETGSPTSRTQRLLKPSWRGDVKPIQRSSPTSPWPWSSSSGEESTRSICPAVNRPDTSVWR